jgi:hypothetical protein
VYEIGIKYSPGLYYKINEVMFQELFSTFLLGIILVVIGLEEKEYSVLDLSKCGRNIDVLESMSFFLFSIIIPFPTFFFKFYKLDIIP